MKKMNLKSILSIVLAALMVVTSFPVVSFAAATEWTRIASSDFKNSNWGASEVQKDGSTNVYYYNNASASPVLNAGDNALTWSGKSYATTISTGASGTEMGDGYIFASGYSDSANHVTPITGLSEFKIDLAFTFFNNDSSNVTGNDKYCFLKLGSDSNKALGKQNDDMKTNNVISQDARGRVYIDGTAYGNGDANHSVSVNNAYLSQATNYHYVMEYSHGRLSTYINDDNNNRIVNICSVKTVIDTTKIQNILFGTATDGDPYMKGINYRNITFYGAEPAQKDNVDIQGKNKYLFAYFKSQEDEAVCYAVSDDGYNFEALNGNQPILSNLKFDGSVPDIYGSTAADGGIAASNHVRDPFILPDHEGNGYYILATDLNAIQNNYSNTKLLVWHVDDLAQSDKVEPWNVETSGWFSFYDQVATEANQQGGANTVKNFFAWAPEAIWDREKNMYMLYWSAGSSLDSNNKTYENLKVHYAYTKDFKNFTDENGTPLGKQADGTWVQPKQLLEPGYKFIDANITYDGDLYYMYYKHEKEQQIYYATAEHANGPYSHPAKFTDNDYKDHLEGVEVYQLTNGSYVMMMDNYNNNGHFLFYGGAALDNFSATTLAANADHLSPRHGYVTRISNDEYNNLIKAYGKQTYSGSGLTDGTDVNSHLIARYFTTGDPTYDATGNGYTLNAQNVQAVNAGDLPGGDRTVGAKFTPVSKATSGAPGNSSYATLDMSQFADRVNGKDGVTFSWYANSNATSGYSRFIDMVPQGSSLGSGSNPDYAFVAASGRYAIKTAANKNEVLAEESNYPFATGTWNRYTVTLSNGYMSIYRDGVLLRSVYSKGAVTKTGSPLYCAAAQDDWFNQMFKGTLGIGISAFASDSLYDGYISDFRIYDRALNDNEILDSISQLTNDDLGIDVSKASKNYYDPFEDMDTTGDGSNDKLAYAQTADDATYGKVLVSDGSAIASKYQFTDHTSVNGGYTLSMWYNSGASVSGHNMFSSTSGSASLSITEEGRLNYSNGTSTLQLTNVFDGKLTANDWNHIVVQVVPNGGWDMLYFYVDGKLVSSFDTFQYSSVKADTSVSDYFEKLDLSISYFASSAIGSMDDFTIYGGYVNANSIYLQDNYKIADTLIQAAKQNFKDKMSTIDADHVYTNMAEAYAVYDKICRYETSVNNIDGKEFDTDKIIQLYDEMNVALDNMNRYEKPATMNGLTVGEAKLNGSTPIPERYTHNMLSHIDMSAAKEHGTQSSASAAVFTSSFVWLYDGDTVNMPTAPIGCRLYKNKSLTAAEPYTFAITQSGSNMIQLGGTVDEPTGYHMWKVYNANGVADDTAPEWYYNIENDSNLKEVASDANDHNHRVNVYSNKTRVFGSNYLTLTNSFADCRNESNVGNEYFTTIQPAYDGYVYWKGGFPSKEHFDGPFAMAEVGKIYIINYERVKTALLDEGRIEILKQCTEYSPDAIKELLSAYDALTGQSYLFGNEISDNAISNLATTLDEGVKRLEGVTLPGESDKIADYNPALDAVKENSEFYNTEDSSQYTTSSWAAFSNAYNAIQNHFESIDPFTDDQPFATRQDVVDRIAKQIASAKEHLVEKADYTDVEKATESAKTPIDNYNADNSQYFGYTAWTDYSGAYDSAKAIADTSEAKKNDTPMYALEYKLLDLGPYVPVDANGNILTDITSVNDERIDSFVFVGGTFYVVDEQGNPVKDKNGDYIPDPLDESNVIYYNGAFVNVSGVRATVNTVNRPTFSKQQNNIVTSAENVTVKYDYMQKNGVLGDYENYDYSQYLASLADRDAYKDGGAGIAANIKTYGTKTNPAEYNNVAGSPYINVNGVAYKDASQTEADAATTVVLNTLNGNGALKSFMVTFNVYVDDAEPVTTTYEKMYGDIVQLNAVDLIGSTDGMTVARCEITSTDNTGSAKTSVINNNTFLVTRRIQEDTVVDLYLASKPADETARLIKVQDYFGAPLDAGYAAQGSEIAVDNANGTISYTDINGKLHEVSVNVSAYYDFANWYAIGATIGDTVTVADSDITFKQNGSKHVSSETGGTISKTYVANGGTIDGETSVEIPEKNVVMNIKADDTTNFLVWVKSCKENAQKGDWTVCSYEPEFKAFTMDEGFVYQVVTNDTAGEFLTEKQLADVYEKLPFSFGNAAEIINVDGVDKFRLYCDFTWDSSVENITIVEAGAIYSSVHSDESTLFKGNNDTRTVVANSINDSANAYTITKTGIGTGNHYMRSYVSFTYTVTVGEGENAQVTTIPRVVYGPVVKCENGKISK